MKKRIPISVEAVFDDDGALIPKKLFYKGRTFEIERLIGIRNYCPKGITCVSPTEYVAVIDGLRRRYISSKALINGFPSRNTM